MSEDAHTNLDSEESKSVETENQSDDTLQTKNDRLYAEVKSLRAESKDRRLKLEAFEKADKEREDAELSQVEKLTKERDTAVASLNTERATAARNNLNSQFTQHAVEAGLPAKIAKVAIPSDLSEDNMKSAVKDAIKEFSEFVKTEEKEKPKANNPFSSVQPKPNSTEKGASNKAPTMDAVMGEFTNHINRDK